MDVIQRYLDCGDLHFGFVHAKGENCDHEYLLTFSCKHGIFALPGPDLATRSTSMDRFLSNKIKS